MFVPDINHRSKAELKLIGPNQLEVNGCMVGRDDLQVATVDASRTEQGRTSSPISPASTAAWSAAISSAQ